MQHGRQRIAAQSLVILQIFVAQRQSIDPLGQRHNSWRYSTDTEILPELLNSVVSTNDEEAVTLTPVATQVPFMSSRRSGSQTMTASLAVTIKP